MGRSRPIRIGLLVFPQHTALDVVGPLEAFSAASSHAGSTPYYQTILVGTERGPVQAESGVRLVPDCLLSTAPDLDTVIVPGGRGLRTTKVNEMIRPWLLSRARGTRRVASVCTGIFGLAPTGLLDGRRVTTHWAFADEVARQFPKLNVEANAIFIRDGKFYTSAGVTAGIDMALGMVEEDLGATVALSAARELVVYLKRSGGQEQYSEPLRYQMRSGDRFGDLIAWIDANLHRRLTVGMMASFVHLSARHFSREFKQQTGLTPADFVEQRRLEEARVRLTNSRSHIGSIATSVGFSSDDAFRRAFERRFGIAPRYFRQHFAEAHASTSHAQS